MLSTTLPYPCLPTTLNQPSYHISNMGTGPHDGNAIFRYKGVWHAMHQANWTDWAHLVSTDLAHWSRISSALSPNGDWDGSLTLLPDGQPVILFDCYNVPDCNGSVLTRTSRRQAPRPSTQRPEPNDHPLVGVARPSNISDPNLTKWHKDPRNPIRLFDVHGRPVTSGFAGPSNLFAAPDGLSFVMQLGRAIARLRLAEPTLHNWTVADAAFYPTGGHGGHGASGLSFYPLKPVERVEHDAAAAPPYDAFLGNLWVNGQSAGTQYVVLGRYVNGTFTPSAPAQRIDASDLVIFGSMQCSGGRCLHLGWFSPGCLTVPRELTYEHSLLTGPRMLSYPAKELHALRVRRIGEHSAVPIKPGDHLAVFGVGEVSRIFDIDAQIALPDVAHGGGMAIEVSILASNAAIADVVLTLEISDSVGSVSRVDASVGVPRAPKASYNATMSFNSTLGGKSTLPLRILADKMIVEIFVDGGRAVLSAPVLAPTQPTERGNVYFRNRVATNKEDRAYAVSLQAWAMGCGWASYP